MPQSASLFRQSRGRLERAVTPNCETPHTQTLRGRRIVRRLSTMRGAFEGIITMCASPFVTRGPPNTAISCQAAGPAILKPALQSACDEVLGAQRRLKAVNPAVQTYRDRINRKIGVAILWAAVGVIPIPAFA